VNRPNRQTRYARGKSDAVDAEAAARAVLSGEAIGLAKVDTEYIGMIRALRVARRSAMKMRTQTFQQMKALMAMNKGRPWRGPMLVQHPMQVRLKSLVWDPPGALHTRCATAEVEDTSGIEIGGG
jgi:hypothetical protein